MKEYRIGISDPFEYDGPNPIIAIGLGLVYGPNIPNWQKSDFLLEVKEPFVYKGKQVKYLLISPRHAPNTIEDVQNKACSAGIGRLKDGVQITVGSQYSSNDVEYWAIGGISPI